MYTNSLKKAALATAIVTSLGAGSVANASIIDQPVFQIMGAVVVWGGDGNGTAGSVRDFIIDHASGDIDLIAGDVQPVMTGNLDDFSPNPHGTTSGIDLDSNGDGVIDGSDSLTEFGPTEGGLAVSASAVQESSFYVASNTTFSISATAVATGDATSLEKIERTMAISVSGDDGIPYGTAARLPYTGPAESHILLEGTIDQLTGGDVFVGDASTAQGAGSIAEQSVRFTNSYSLTNDGADFSNGPAVYSADVTYTIAIP